MKKTFLIISFIFINTNLFSQINFPDAKQCLKEFLAIQALLAENRIDEVKEFIIKNSYHYLDEDSYYKYDLLNPPIENDIIPIINICEISNQNQMFCHYYIKIFFMRIDKNDKKKIVEDKGELQTIENIMKNQYELGMPFFTLKSYTIEKIPKEMIIEKIDRYNIKISSTKSSNYSILKASNFTLYPNFDNKNLVNFLGPGKTTATVISHVHNKTNEYGYHIEITSFKTNSPEKKEKFNIDFFMSLKDFNDRIWDDNE